nr:hypothetical protein [Tanacetum cinerariifolium]
TAPQPASALQAEQALHRDPGLCPSTRQGRSSRCADACRRRPGIPGSWLPDFRSADTVEVVIEGRAQTAQRAVTATLPERVLIARQTRAADAGTGVDGRHALGIGAIRRSGRLMGACGRDLHVRTVTQRFGDQTVELRIAEAGPP